MVRVQRPELLVGIQRAHVELYIRPLGESGLMPSSVTTSMPAVRGFLRFAHIDGLIPSDPAVYAILPKVGMCSRMRRRTQATGLIGGGAVQGSPGVSPLTAAARASNRGSPGCDHRFQGAA
jgi:hypothetical protein